MIKIITRIVSIIIMITITIKMIVRIKIAIMIVIKKKNYLKTEIRLLFIMLRQNIQIYDK